jgi:UDP-hydrolysing UDP-N-acetyl-D-glucosamine 2-epimerase
MKVLVITGSRADRNGLEVVHEALLKAWHTSHLWQADDFGYSSKHVDAAIVGGDRFEVLEAVVELARRRIPIAHIAGGDVTEGSADNRYRDAITALSCIHFATNAVAFNRITGGDYNEGPLSHKGDKVYMTGSPAIDRIKQTAVLTREGVFKRMDWRLDQKAAIVCVHPNTVESEPMMEARAVVAALSKIEIQCVCLGANADPGGEAINSVWRDWSGSRHQCVFAENVSPQLYYSLMTHCDVMVGNSSAMLYEAPSFGLQCVLVGDRQRGRTIPDNVYHSGLEPDRIAEIIMKLADHGRSTCENPYGDGNSAPRIVEALEENVWRWLSERREVSHVKHVENELRR